MTNYDKIDLKEVTQFCKNLKNDELAQVKIHALTAEYCAHSHEKCTDQTVVDRLEERKRNLLRQYAKATTNTVNTYARKLYLWLKIDEIDSQIDDYYTITCSKRRSKVTLLEIPVFKVTQ